MKSCSDFFDFHLFADDTNLFSKHKSLSFLQAIINDELTNVHSWLCANKLSLNAENSSFVVSYPPQRKIPSLDLTINGKIPWSNLSWKPQVDSIVKKLKGALEYYQSCDIM